ncbi:MAG TPA: lysophospholipid acyltransferase family protein [Bacteroidales bacterium]|nr:lysophospholipid acyltransferase family protein [Bacteroidales bacterium]HPT01207.1 lysophospholipid acyltransferase family protein [Bacteroidales bacterium]
MNFKLGIIKAINRLFSLLPFWVIYLKSDFIAFILRRVIRYRRNVVEENLRNSFPEKSTQEREAIARKFYRNLSDIIVEIFKTRGMTAGELQRRMKVVNPELLDHYRRLGRSVIMVSGHCGNWEWYAPATAMQCPGFDHNCALVKPLSDPVSEEFITSLRTRFMKDVLLPFKSAYRVLLSRRRDQNLTAILADQTPHRSEIEYHTLFLNQQTAFFLGAEKIARSLDHVVMFSHIRRVKRGYYEVTFELITDTPKLTRDFEITNKHIALLEKDIIENPDNWLWSHRRWKYKIDN